MLALSVYVQKDSELTSDGVPWWTVGGTTKRIAAYLWFNVSEGGTFTMAEVRAAAQIEKQTQSDRRMRELREQGWVVVGYKDDKSLPMDSYRLVKRGLRLWLGERAERDAISNKLRRQVFARDNNTCVICGISVGDEYPDMPGSKARMTVGHRIPNQRLGEATLENLQTECARCNEPIRNLLKNPDTFEDVEPLLKDLSASELKALMTWIDDGKKTFSKLDLAYAKVRYLSPGELSKAKDFIRKAID